MFSTQLEQIQNRKQKAFAIFHKTKNSLLNTIEQAKAHIDLNREAILQKSEEVRELKSTNDALFGHIDEISASINQIDTIIGVGK